MIIMKKPVQGDILKLTILGTGCASVTDCYNTCFVLSDNGQNFMVDGGGGNTIFKQLKSAGINWKSIRHIFYYTQAYGPFIRYNVVCTNDLPTYKPQYI